MPPTASGSDATPPVGLAAGDVQLDDALPVKRGRKRQHDSPVERRMILDAAMVVMRRNGFAEARITDILQEAGLSNRAFYRHFSSKDELLLGMCGRDIAYVVRQLRTKISQAPDPASALHVYVDSYLKTFLDPPEPDRDRIGVLGSESARRAEGYDAEVRRLDRLVAEPLLEVLREGAATGIFRSVHPDVDGYTIYVLIQGMLGLPAEIRPGHDEATAQVLRFCAPAIGLVETTSA